MQINPIRFLSWAGLLHTASIFNPSILIIVLSCYCLLEVIFLVSIELLLRISYDLTGELLMPAFRNNCSTWILEFLGEIAHVTICKLLDLIGWRTFLESVWGSQRWWWRLLDSFPTSNWLDLLGPAHKFINSKVISRCIGEYPVFGVHDFLRRQPTNSFAFFPQSPSITAIDHHVFSPTMLFSITP